MSVQKLMYAIFFSTQGPPMQIAAIKGRGVTGKIYRDKVLLDFSLTVKAAPHECVILTSRP